MTRERVFYIAHRICNYMRNRESPYMFQDYEFCMYVADLASEIEYAIDKNDGSGLQQYYNMLHDELENFYSVEYHDDLLCYIEEVKELISLLDEWK